MASCVSMPPDLRAPGLLYLLFICSLISWASWSTASMADDRCMLVDLPPDFAAAWGEDEPSVSRREKCGRCAKPSKVCLCSVLPAEKMRTRVKVLILQHPEEAGAAKGTVSLLQLCLSDCRVITGRKFKRQDLPADLLLAAEQRQRARSGVMDSSTARWQRTLLLWPAPDAEDLEHVALSLGRGHESSSCARVSLDEANKQASEGSDDVLLVLLDGTWPSCGQMLQKSEILRGLRTVRISPPGESLYAIRMQPCPASRSTLEAAAHSIAILGEDPGTVARERSADGGEEADADGIIEGAAAVRDRLLAVLSRMVELQCAHITKPKHRNTESKHYRPNKYKIAAIGSMSLGACASDAARSAEQSPRTLEHRDRGEVDVGGESGAERGNRAEREWTLGATRAASEIVQEFVSKRKNKTALLQHLVTTAQRIEQVWDKEPLSERYEMLGAYRHCLELLGEEEEEGDTDLRDLARLAPKIKTLHFPLSHWLALVLPVERKYSKGVRDEEFLVTSADAGKPAARRSAQQGSSDLCLPFLPDLNVHCLVILDNLRSAFNVGSILRTCECIFGSCVVSVVLTGYTATPEDAATRKAAMGMDKVVPWRWLQSVDEAIADAKAGGLTVFALETVEGSPLAHDFTFPRRCAVVLGNERHGLEPRHIAQCHASVQLPCRSSHHSECS